MDDFSVSDTEPIESCPLQYESLIIDPIDLQFHSQIQEPCTMKRTTKRSKQLNVNCEIPSSPKANKSCPFDMHFPINYAVNIGTPKMQSHVSNFKFHSENIHMISVSTQQVAEQLTENINYFKQNSITPVSECLQQAQCNRCITTIVNDELFEIPNKMLLLDNRWNYEFCGGSVITAVNMHDGLEMKEQYLVNPVLDPDTQIIFYCQYSSRRGPAMCNYFSQQNRLQNNHYQNICLMEGGYNSFFLKYPTLTTTGKYVREDDPLFTQQKEQMLLKYKNYNMNTSEEQLDDNQNEQFILE